MHTDKKSKSPRELIGETHPLLILAATACGARSSGVFAGIDLRIVESCGNTADHSLAHAGTRVASERG